MKFAALQPTSTLDFPGKLSAILFVGGCVFRCPYCHNPDLIDPKKNVLSEEEVLTRLESRKKFVDAVSLTGGEITLHKDLPDFIRKLKDKGFSVKIDTNGTNPEMIEKILPMLDFIAMDVKATLTQEHYDRTTKVKTDIDSIDQSIHLIKNSGTDYEFRTTVVEKLFSVEKFKELGKVLKGSKKHVIQQFVNRRTLDPDYQNEIPYLKDQLFKIRSIMKEYVDQVEIRGI